MSRARRLGLLALLTAFGCGGSSAPPNNADLKVPNIPPAGRNKDPGGKRPIPAPVK
jgi:hypothetical protein